MYSGSDKSIKYVCKVKVITLNYLNCIKINFETIRRIVTQDNNDAMNWSLRNGTPWLKGDW